MQNRCFWLNGVENLVHRASSKTGFIAIDCYVRVLLFLYPLYLTEAKFLYFFSEKIALLIIIFFAVMTIFLFPVLHQVTGYEKKLYRMELGLIILLLLLMVNIFIKIIHDNLEFENEVFFICLVGTILILRNFRINYQYYMRLFLYMSILLYADLLWYFFSGMDTLLGTEILLRHSGAVQSVLFLTVGLSTLLYCNLNDKRWNFFYLGITGIGSLLFFLYFDMASICLMGIFLLIIPVFFTPTVELIKRNLTICFIFLFAGSVVPLLQFCKLIRLEHELNLLYSIYIDFFLAIAGVMISKYWTKIPKDVPADKIVMKKFRKWYIQAIIILISVITGVLFMGDKLNSLPNEVGIHAIKDFGNTLARGIQSNKSFFQFVLEEYGVLGEIVWICMSFSLGKRLLKQWKKGDILVRILCAVSWLFFIQLFIYSLWAETGPAYVIFMSFALYADNDMNRYKTLESVTGKLTL